MVFVDLFYNLTLLVAFSVVSGIVAQRWRITSLPGELLQGFLFGSAAVAGMLRPLVVAPGIIFDGRSVMISLCALFFGCKAVVVASFIAVLLRLYQGGAGAFTGSVVILSSAFIGLIFRWRYKEAVFALKTREFIIIGLVVHVAMLAEMFLLPGNMAMSVLKIISLPVLLLYPLVTALIGNILAGQEAFRNSLETLRRSEEQYRLVMNNMYDVLWVMDMKTLGWIYLSPSIERLTGYTVEEVFGISHSKIATAESHSRFNSLVASRRESFFKNKAEKHVYVDEFEQVRKDGMSVWVEVVSKYIETEWGEAVIQGVTRDVDSRKKAELLRDLNLKKLRESEERISALLNAIPDLIFVFSRDGFFKDFHIGEKAPPIIEPQTFIGRHFRDFLPPDLTDIVLTNMQMLFETGQPRYVEYEATLGARKCLFEGRMVESGKNDVLVIVRDISEHKRVEEALYETEQIFNQFMENSPVYVFFKDSDIRSIRLSRNYEQMLGRPLDELIGKTMDELFPSDLAKSMIADDQRILREGKLVTAEEEFNGRFYTTIKFPIRQKNGSNYLAGYTIDNTEKILAERENRRLEQQIQHTQKLESLGVLAGGIAHDFNNILMAVLGHAELAMFEISSLSPARGNILQIITATRRAAELCRQMLTYSGKTSFILEPLNLNELIEEMSDLLKASISKKVIMNIRSEKSCPLIMADSSQIGQVLMNLIVNGSDAIGDHNGLLTISTGTEWCDEQYLTSTELREKLSPGLYAYMEVSDNGCGMDEATRTRIFEPFFSTKFTGRGLGLAAVLGIIRAHNGLVKVDSELGKGTTFKVMFPAMEGETKKCTEPSSPILGIYKNRGTVLLVDDEEEIRALSKTLLELFGFNVLTACDGVEAVDVYKKNSDEIVLIILDLTMPRMDGAETFAVLHRLRPDVKVVIASGYSKEDIASQFSGTGLAGVLQKPFSQAQLSGLLAEILQ